MTKRGIVRAAVTAAVAVVATGTALISASAAPQRLAAPRLLGPSAATVAALPVFSWNPVRGAEHYEFQIAADGDFNSPVPGAEPDDFLTWNTHATLGHAVPNGQYWWHVRAVSKRGAVSGWSPTYSVRKRWGSAPVLRSPARGAAVHFPSEPVVLSWSAVPRASKYLVSLANDSDLGSLVGGRSVETASTSFAPSVALPSAGPGGKTYYWGVTPEDADGNRGTPSKVGRFTLQWKSQTKVHLADLRSEPETLDPQFSWDPVPGAASYQLEISSSRDFAPGSQVCCSKPLYATSYSPTANLRDNTYYWRVRPLDADGNAGAWSPENPAAQPFRKVFDTAESLSGPAIDGLHMRDNLHDPGVDQDESTAGYQTHAPVVVWKPVPGASSYFVEVAAFGASHCNWSQTDWRVTTAVPAWTPLGNGLIAQPPYPDAKRPATDLPKLSDDTQYCVRVRARADRDGQGAEVSGDFTYLNGPDHAAFTFMRWAACTKDKTPDCSRQKLSDAEYLLPTGTRTTTPYFTWRDTGAGSYFVVVAKDPEFHTVVDYGFTQVPAYAPRTTTTSVTYSDETTSYYWAVLPAAGFGGQDALGDPRSANPQSFNKQSEPPALKSLDAGERVANAPVFRWTPVEGARRYHIQVSQDGDFGHLLDDVTTDSTAFTGDSKYPADVALYWRVRAEDENGVGLTWSDRRVFRHHLPAPAIVAGSAGGSMIPTWRWRPLQGTMSYDLHAELPNGTTRDFMNLHTTAFTPTTMTGTGVFHWQVRGNFPRTGGAPVSGPYTRSRRFTRTVGRPTGARLVPGRGVAFSWNPTPGVKSYRLQLSANPDFAMTLENVFTNNTVFAPLMRVSYPCRTTLYWRVSAIDADQNRGGFSKTVRFRLSRGCAKKPKPPAIGVRR